MFHIVPKLKISHYKIIMIKTIDSSNKGKKQSAYISLEKFLFPTMKRLLINNSQGRGIEIEWMVAGVSKYCSFPFRTHILCSEVCEI
jgi:hypothetical protein